MGGKSSKKKKKKKKKPKKIGYITGIPIAATIPDVISDLEEIKPEDIVYLDDLYNPRKKKKKKKKKKGRKKR